MRRLPAFPALLGLLAACAPPADAPDLSRRAAAAGPYPRLLPLEQLLAAPPARITPEGDAAAEARAAALRARAAALSGPVLSGDDRARIDAAQEGLSAAEGGAG